MGQKDKSRNRNELFREGKTKVEQTNITSYKCKICIMSKKCKQYITITIVIMEYHIFTIF